VEEYTIVTLEEALHSLPELLRRVAQGEELIITDGGKPVAALTAPPDVPLTPEEIEAARDHAKAAVRQMMEALAAQRPVLEDGTRMADLLAQLEQDE
jgi:prevent-host-death family protein